MKSSLKSWLIPTLLILLLPCIIPRASAQSAALYPAHGTVNTEVFLQVRGIGGQLYLFWDDFLFDVYTANVPDFAGFDIHFYPPNEHPYSDLGNHTVFLQVWWKYWDGHDIYVEWNCTLTFQITEQVPCQEYLVLNATYYALLADHNALNAEYNALETHHNDLNSTYQELLSDYNTKLASYNSLSKSYESLCDDYDTLETGYNSLQSDNDELATNYNALTNELSAARNLSYLFIAATMILIAVTVYFAVRKPKMKAA